MRHRLCSVDELAVGTGKEFTAGDRIVALFRVGHTFHAIDGICPHAGGPLGAGCLVGAKVTCPWHGWQFDVATGKHGLNPRLEIERFPVSLEGDSVYVELPEA